MHWKMLLDIHILPNTSIFGGNRPWAPYLPQTPSPNRGLGGSRLDIETNDRSASVPVKSYQFMINAPAKKTLKKNKSIQSLKRPETKDDIPTCSMYGNLTYIYYTNQPNGGKYAIHGASEKFKFNTFRRSGQQAAIFQRLKQQLRREKTYRTSTLWYAVHAGHVAVWQWLSEKGGE